MNIPTNAFSLMTKIYRHAMPNVHLELSYWKARASEIPNDELRKQALTSIEQKTFHCEGGGILALLAGAHRAECIRFIVAYQTISDYLDNLCDRSTSLDPKDFTALHEAMNHSLIISSSQVNYYRYRDDQDDGGYLHELVQVCQESLAKTKHYNKINKILSQLAQYYCDLQVYKHVSKEKRENLLSEWFDLHKKTLPKMHWYEFSACAGSTLGIFCLVAYAFHDDLCDEQIEKIKKGYFPYVQGLHILLDYFIDQKEDKLGGDLNFCSYYESESYMMERFRYFIEEADRHIEGVPHAKFHLLINRGLIGVYLSDEKVQQQEGMKKLAKQLVKFSGVKSLFFYMNGKMYRSLKRYLEA